MIRPGRIIAKVIRGARHHLFSNKFFKKLPQWSKKYQSISTKAGKKLTDCDNIVRVLGHQGPHPEEMHKYVFDALVQATRNKKPYSKEFTEAVEKLLKRLAKEAQTPGSRLNKWLTE